MGNSLLFRRIPLSQLTYFQFPVISNKEKFVLAFVINIIFPVIYFYNSVNCDRPGECSPEKDCLR